MDEQKNKHNDMHADPSSDEKNHEHNAPSEGAPADETPVSTPTVAPTTPITPESTEPVTPESKSSALPFIIGIAIIVLLGVGAFFLLGQNNDSTSLNTDTSTDEQETNTSGFASDSVVATVNGVELLGEDLTYQMAQVAQSAGVQNMEQLDQETLSAVQSQATDALINSEILRQTATEEGLTVSQDEVEAEFNSIVESVGGEEEASERLATLGITEEEFRAELEGDLLIQKYIETNVDTSGLEVTEEEVQAFYEQVSSQQQGDIPSLADVRGQIEEQLQFQKEQEAIQGLLQGLREAADVEIF